MKKFTCVADIGDLTTAVAEAMEIKRDRFQFTGLGRNRTLLMLFFNSSLRTRLSTQKAAMNLGMNVMVLDVNQGAWKLETQRGVVMDGDKAEHLLEAIPVMDGASVAVNEFQPEITCRQVAVEGFDIEFVTQDMGRRIRASAAPCIPCPQYACRS